MSETGTRAADAPEDLRPVVRTGYSGNRSLWIVGVALLAGGFLLFQALDARRQDLAAPESKTVQGSGAITAPPPLTLPPGYAEPEPDPEPWPVFRRTRPAEGAVTVSRPAPPQVVTRIVEREVPAPVPPASLFQPVPPPPMPVVLDRAPGELAAAAAAAPGQAGQSRVTAGRLLNPSLTVPQGTVIAAVLETALDSTRPGAARAIVSRDVMSFDGTRVLIPRGSRLYGEYASDVSAGQRRALVRWQRLTRPDAVIINLDSPSADPLGRAGISGKVNTHFFERFGGAILQSVLDIGVGLATRQVTDDAVIVALPGSTQQVTGQLQPQQFQPTLKVRQGASVSVFVARDLDFSTVDR